MSGYAGCNQYFSSYAQHKSAIQFTGSGTTKMFCKDTMETEQKFIKALTEVSSFKTEGNKLLFLAGDIVVLEFIQ